MDTRHITEPHRRRVKRASRQRRRRFDRLAAHPTSARASRALARACDAFDHHLAGYEIDLAQRAIARARREGIL